MIIEEFNKILKHTNEDEIGILLNDLYDEFRDGRDRNDVLILLNSDNESMRYFGCDILNETSIDDSNLEKEITDKLNDIISHDSSDLNKMRAFHAMYGIFLDNKDVNGLFEFCQEMKNNSDEFIKKDAINFLEKHKTAPENYDFKVFLKHLYGDFS